MAEQFDIHDAKTNLSRIIERVEQGEEFDRILVAQARCEELTLVTRDPYCLRYEVDSLRC
ncbi:hypothetical protein [Nocardia sp. NPDC058633]|uniref:hypothetical protein n=1 Tax=Nocardia sp. NPDC058633 TaxID=3346568 RepID=UPI00365EE50D